MASFMAVSARLISNRGAIKGNLEALLADLKKAKPAAAKGVYLKKISLSTTMGPGIVIDQGR